MDAEPVLGLERLRHEQQRRIQRVEDDLQHPQRDDQRDPDQQPGDQVLPQRSGNEVLFHGFCNEKARTRAGPVRSRKVDAAAQAAALDSVLVSGFASGLDSVLLSVLVSAFLSADFFAPPLKSVAYHPVPLSWKPAAESCLRYSGLPQAGHTESGASDTFCRCSSWCPQIAQRYS